MRCTECNRKVTRVWKVRVRGVMATHSQMFPIIMLPKEMCNKCKTVALINGGKVVR